MSRKKKFNLSKLIINSLLFIVLSLGLFSSLILTQQDNLDFRRQAYDMPDYVKDALEEREKEESSSVATSISLDTATPTSTITPTPLEKKKKSSDKKNADIKMKATTTPTPELKGTGEGCHEDSECQSNNCIPAPYGKYCAPQRDDDEDQHPTATPTVTPMFKDKDKKDESPVTPTLTPAPTLEFQLSPTMTPTPSPVMDEEEIMAQLASCQNTGCPIGYDCFEHECLEVNLEYLDQCQEDKQCLSDNCEVVNGVLGLGKNKQCNKTKEELKHARLHKTYQVVNTVTFGTFRNYLESQQKLNKEYGYGTADYDYWDRVLNYENIRSSTELGAVISGEIAVVVTTGGAAAGALPAGGGSLGLGVAGTYRSLSQTANRCQTPDDFINNKECRRSAENTVISAISAGATGLGEAAQLADDAVMLSRAQNMKKVLRVAKLMPKLETLHDCQKSQQLSSQECRQTAINLAQEISGLSQELESINIGDYEVGTEELLEALEVLDQGAELTQEVRETIKYCQEVDYEGQECRALLQDSMAKVADQTLEVYTRLGEESQDEGMLARAEIADKIVNDSLSVVSKTAQLQNCLKDDDHLDETDKCRAEVMALGQELSVMVNDSELFDSKISQADIEKTFKISENVLDSIDEIRKVNDFCQENGFDHSKCQDQILDHAKEIASLTSSYYQELAEVSGDKSMQARARKSKRLTEISLEMVDVSSDLERDCDREDLMKNDDCREKLLGLSENLLEFNQESNLIDMNNQEDQIQASLVQTEKVYQDVQNLQTSINQCQSEKDEAACQQEVIDSSHEVVSDVIAVYSGYAKNKNNANINERVKLADKLAHGSLDLAKYLDESRVCSEDNLQNPDCVEALVKVAQQSQTLLSDVPMKQNQDVKEELMTKLDAVDRNLSIMETGLTLRESCTSMSDLTTKEECLSNVVDLSDMVLTKKISRDESQSDQDRRAKIREVIYRFEDNYPYDSVNNCQKLEDFSSPECHRYIVNQAQPHNEQVIRLLRMNLPEDLKTYIELKVFGIDNNQICEQLKDNQDYDYQACQAKIEQLEMQYQQLSVN